MVPSVKEAKAYFGGKTKKYLGVGCGAGAAGRVRKYD
jgi:hypothetical protein